MMPGRLLAARRVLVVTKFRYLGDTIVATPFLRRLKEAIPQAEVTLLAGPAIPLLLEGCPYVRDIWSHSPDHGGLRRNLDLVHRVRARAFDAAFLLNRSLHSALVAAVARVPIRIGFRSEYRGPLLTLSMPYDRRRAESECFLDLLRASGVEAPPGGAPELWVTAAEKADARALVAAPGELARPLVLVQPGAKDAYRKQWASVRFAETLSAIAEETGGTAAAIGAEEEAEACSTVAGLARVPVCNLAGRTSLRQVLALIAEADMLLANETAMVHVAAALGTPTVAVCGPQSIGKWTYGPPHRVVTAPPPGGKQDRHANRRALDAIEAGQVVAAAMETLGEWRNRTQ